ncbi:hypothetical protein [Bacillus marinisedimentorum]|uniref:hypothetical protein n=1 Tax=Bacillus marinisedimentorum TaxID=1821260 RepID=UPI0012FFB3C8|nr:hypothetical protein [Bacillus marinisedimentorum]
MAVIETITLSFDTVDEAFSDFLGKEHGVDEKRIEGKAYYQVDNQIYIPYMVNSNTSMARFNRKRFGWQYKGVSHYTNEAGQSFSSSRNELNGEIVVHGLIPKKMIDDIETVKVGNLEAEVIQISEKTAVWLLITDSRLLDSIEEITVSFLDIKGDVLGSIK